MECNVISMCNITCIYNEICHITNEIFQAQITSCGKKKFRNTPLVNNLYIQVVEWILVLT
jgi:hypothetical protein